MVENDFISPRRMSYVRGLLVSADTKRPNAWCEYGFPETVTFHDMYKMYRRNPIAHGGINKIINRTWSTNPWVIVGDKEQDDHKETSWERTARRKLTPAHWDAFRQADLRRLVGGASALILRVNDSSELHGPIKRKNALLVELIPVWKPSLKPIMNQGVIEEYEYTEVGTDGISKQVKIHPDRVFLLGDWQSVDVAFMEPVYNDLINIEKITGGSGETFLKNAARQMLFEFDKEVDMPSIARASGKTVDKMQEGMKQAVRDLNRANDAMIAVHGGRGSVLSTTPADPTAAFNVTVSSISAGWDIPVKILIGNQTGERASTEDWKSFNASCQSRRTNQLAFDISRFIIKLQDVGVLEKTPEFRVLWDDLTEQTSEDKLEIATKMADVNQRLALIGEMPIFTSEEIRVAAGYEPKSEVDPFDENES